jgi:hypothetical protein
MKGLVALAVIAAFASGLIGTWAFSQLTEQAGAAPPPPSPQQVREQNLDGSGFIRVHEQGTANVAGTVNVGNLPSVQDVNVLSMPAQSTGRLIAPGTQPALGSNDTIFSTTDVSDCSEIRAMARTTHSSGLTLEPSIYTSPDGSTRIIAANAVENTAGEFVDGVSTTSGLIAGPHRYIALLVFNSGPTADVTAWLWCQP